MREASEASESSSWTPSAGETTREPVATGARKRVTFSTTARPSAEQPEPLSAWALVVRTYFLVLGTVLFLLFLYTVRDAVRLLLLSAVVAAGVAPWTRRLHELRLPPRGWRVPIAAGVLLIYVGAILVFGIFGAVAVPPIVEQANQLVSNAPTYAEQAQSYVQSLSQQYPWLPVGAGDSAISQLAGQLTGAMQSGFPAFLTVLFGVLGGVLDLIMILTIALYIVLEGETLRNTAIRLLPRHQRGRVSEVVDEITTKTGQWAIGQLMLCGAIFAITLVGLLLIGAPYAFLLALVAGLLEIVPVVGPLIAAVVAVGVTVFSSPFQAMLVAGLYLFVQQVENSFLVPRIMEHAVGISPLTVIVALAVGGSLAGIVGAILAVPVAAAIQVMLGAILRGDVDPSVQEDGSIAVDVNRNPAADARPRGS